MTRPVSRATGVVTRAGAQLVSGPTTQIRRLVSRWMDETARAMRFGAGRLQGLSYRVAGGRPDPAVGDGILADRIRSELGPVLKRRDLPHVHVVVEDHVAVLHGDVPTRADAETIEQAVGEVSGVKGVMSHLHVGLAKGDTRPSAGHLEARTGSVVRGGRLRPALGAGRQRARVRSRHAHRRCAVRRTALRVDPADQRQVAGRRSRRAPPVGGGDGRHAGA